MHPLDNPAWLSLTGEHQSASLGDALARRFDTDISVIAGLADAHDSACWDALGRLPGAEVALGIFNIPQHAPPPGWETLWRYAFAQMVCTPNDFRPTAVTAVPAPLSLRPLTLADGAAMVALATLTQPGPMAIRTVSLGRYLGIFDEQQRLVAMAGERTRGGQYVEVSAVCTHPDVRGRGLAALLMTAIIAPVAASGKSVYLHVREENHAAMGVYEKLGFRTRTVFDIAAVKRAG